jgi:pyridoxal phosphate enzyme (YggS family)
MHDHEHAHTNDQGGHEHAHAHAHAPMTIVGNAPPTVELIRSRRERLMARLRAAAERVGHDPDRLRIVAVTKTWPVSVCRVALEAGCELLGENRVQEAEEKIAQLPEAEWHLVGRLQSNKARRALRGFRMIHSVDSMGLLSRLDTIAGELELTPQLLLQVNLSGEVTKAGFDLDAFSEAVLPGGELTRAVRELRNASVQGLMTVAALGIGEEEQHATFARLRELRDTLQESSGRALPELSMGMTADAEAAAAEGATLVRIGTALFGPRAG